MRFFFSCLRDAFREARLESRRAVLMDGILLRRLVELLVGDGERGGGEFALHFLHRVFHGFLAHVVHRFLADVLAQRLFR